MKYSMNKRMNIFLAVLMTICAAGTSARGTGRGVSNKKDLSPADFLHTSFDYDYGLTHHDGVYDEQRQAGDTEATDRPLIRYWNNFMRNLRIPIPTIQWNMSNPLISMFNGGAANAIETPVGDYDATTSKKRKRKKISSKNRQRPFDFETVQSNSVNGAQEQLQLPATIGAGQTVHFFDPNTGQYYEVVQDQESYYNNYYQPAHNYYEGAPAPGSAATLQPIAVEDANEDDEAPNTSQEEVDAHSGDDKLPQNADDVNMPLDDDYRLDDYDDADVTAAAAEEENVHSDDDDDVAVVSNLDNDSEERLNVATKTNVERLRNAKGVNSHDDQRQRKRQRNKKRGRVESGNGAAKKSHRKRVRYFILNTW